MHVDEFLQVEMSSPPLVQPVAPSGDMLNLSPSFNIGNDNGYI